MDRDTLLSDLEYATQIAKDGRDMPLLGGPIALMWGILLTGAMGAQYLILERILALPLQSLAILWIAFGIIGGAGVFIMVRAADAKDGARSVANRVETAVWTLFAAMVGTLVLAILAIQGLGKASPEIWNLIVPIAFLGQGMAYGIVTRIKQNPVLAFAAIAAFAAGAVAFVLHQEVSVYLVGAIGSFVAIVIPSLLLRKG